MKNWPRTHIKTTHFWTTFRVILTLISRFLEQKFDTKIFEHLLEICEANESRLLSIIWKNMQIICHLGHTFWECFEAHKPKAYGHHRELNRLIGDLYWQLSFRFARRTSKTFGIIWNFRLNSRGKVGFRTFYTFIQQFLVMQQPSIVRHQNYCSLFERFEVFV